MVDIAPLTRVLRNPVTLTQRVANAALWSTGGTVIGRMLALVSHTVMAWFLLPEAFGLIAVITVIHTGVGMVSDIGVQQTIIRSDEGEDARFLQVAWTLRILRSLLLASAVLLAAGALALFAEDFAAPDSTYADPLLPSLVAVSALIVPLGALGSANRMLARRRITIARVAMIGVAAQAVAFVVKVTLIQIYPSVWVLLAGMFSSTITATILSHVILPGPRMRLAWDRGHVSTFWHGGKWFIPASIFGFFARQGDKLLLAGLLDARTFGLYTIAMIWVRVGTQAMQPLNRTIGVAALSEARRDSPQRFHRVLRRYTLHFDLACALIFATAFLAGPTMIELLYSDTYLPAGLILHIASFHYLAFRLRSYAAFLISTGQIKTFAMGPATEAVVLFATILVAYNMLGMPFEWLVLLIALNPTITGLVGLVAAGRAGLVPLRAELFRLVASLAVMTAYVGALTAGLI